MSSSDVPGVDLVFLSDIITSSDEEQSSLYVVENDPRKLREQDLLVRVSALRGYSLD